MALQTKGKEDFLAAFRRNGFNVDEAERAFKAMSHFFDACIRAGDTVYLRGVMKLHARLLPPRSFQDNLNGKVIHFGERVGYLFRDLTKDNPAPESTPEA